MALPDISLAQFNRIASGSYNAGQIDFRTDENGTAELVKVNSFHVLAELVYHPFCGELCLAMDKARLRIRMIV